MSAVGKFAGGVRPCGMSIRPPVTLGVGDAGSWFHRPRRTRDRWLALAARVALASVGAASLAWTMWTRVNPELSVARLSQLLASLHP